jgi:hypothetical protein
MPFLLDSDTLATIPDPKPSDVALWKEGYRIFPELLRKRTSLYSPEGQPFTLDYKSKIDSCTDVVFSVPAHQSERPGWAGCKIMKVFSPQGQLFGMCPYAAMLVVSQAAEHFSRHPFTAITLTRSTWVYNRSPSESLSTI